MARLCQPKCGLWQLGSVRKKLYVANSHKLFEEHSDIQKPKMLRRGSVTCCSAELGWSLWVPKTQVGRTDHFLNESCYLQR